MRHLDEGAALTMCVAAHDTRIAYGVVSLDGIRVAVAPLRYGAGVKGKVNQSMAYGQPVVATPIAVEGMEIVAGSEALVAAEPAEFAEEVVRLYQDPDLWLRLSDAGLANIESHFSFDAASRALQRILRG